MFLKKNKYILKSKKTRIEKSVRIVPRNNTKVIIGKYSSINGPDTHIMSFFNDIVIGNYTSIAMGVKILDYNHRVLSLSNSRIQKLMNINNISDYNTKGPIIIGNDVWVGMDCNILSGVTLGDGCIISSNSTVTKNVEPYSIVGGSPARVLKMRFSSDIIKILQKIKWWNYDINELIPHQNIFKKDKLSIMDVKLLESKLKSNL